MKSRINDISLEVYTFQRHKQTVSQHLCLGKRISGHISAMGVFILKGGSSQGINTLRDLFHYYCSTRLYLVKVPGRRFPSQMSTLAMWEESS